ncbi:hypothetical protein [Dyadobacter sp. CY347]|uniref:hypothetical protein n=1 Tax=Dyadobacter sp. CY347 TaxID=2909336 RepID=UPI001F40D5FF|nr:hypothetical protein [Dyadobacter sp. CY347]MCF2491560.1 hypothetical protein [Dyadobacter sp. CY347]
MRKPAILLDGKSMWRWLLLALLLTSIVSQNFAEPKSIYRIEEVISNAGKNVRSYKTGTFCFSSENLNKQNAHSNYYSLQYEHLRALSKTRQLNTELAISTAPDIQPIRMQATGQLLKNRSYSSEKPFQFLS